MTRPSHMLADGSIVYPQGYAAADLTPLAGDFWDGVDFAAARASKMAALSRAFEQRLSLGCASAKGWVDCDDKAQTRIANMLQLRREATLAGVAVDEAVNWTMYDKSQVLHGQDDLVALGLAIGFGFAAIFARKQALEGQIAGAMDLAALDAVNVEEGWP